MIFFLFFTIFLTFLIAKQHWRFKKLPPGPVSLPLIGNIPQLVYYVWRENGVVPAFDLFRKTYGDVFTLWLGPIPHVSITDYETAHEVFVKNGNKYKDRFLPPIFEHVSDGLGLIFANGEMWAEMRRFTQLTFRNMGVGRNVMEERIMKELNARCEELDASAVDGKTIVHTSEFFDLTVGSVINSLLIGKRFDADNKDEFLNLKKLMEKDADTFSIFDMTMPVWILKTFFRERYDRNVNVRLDILNFVSREAIQRRFRRRLLAKMEQEDQNRGHPAYTMENLKTVLSDMWLAGQETTSTTLVSGFNQLVNHPHVILKIREELLRVTSNGSRLLRFQDRLETPYLNATIAEVQRHASILSMNFWRINHEPTTVKGYPVDSGSVITAQIGALDVNGNILKDPERFYPERFIENEKLVHQTLPFGIGKRSCVGKNIAMAELYLVFGNLILRYDFKPHGLLPSTADCMPFGSGKLPDKTVRLEFVKL